LQLEIPQVVTTLKSCTEFGTLLSFVHFNGQ